MSLLLNTKKNFEKKLTKFNIILVKNYLRVIGKLTGETVLETTAIGPNDSILCSYIFTCKTGNNITNRIPSYVYDET